MDNAPSRIIDTDGGQSRGPTTAEVERRRVRAAESPVTPAPTRRRLIEAKSPVEVSRLLSANDLFRVNWLSIGLRVARTVARLEIPGKPGTGVLVSPELLLTNSHLLRDVQDAATCTAVFNHQAGERGRPEPVERYSLAPERCFLTDPDLDFTLVAIDPAAAAQFGFSQLIGDTGKVSVGEHVTIIQHPRGGPKYIAFRANRVTEIADNALRYETDTLPGSSGSPVFSDQWELVALHRRGHARRDADGYRLRRNGKRATPKTPDYDIDWIANEGVRVSRILRSVAAMQVDGEAERLVHGLRQVRRR